MKLFLFLTFAVAGFAQNVFDLTGPTNIRPGNVINMAVNLTGTSMPAASQFTVNTTADISALSVTIGAAGTAAGKVVSCGVYTANALTCVLYGLTNVNTIANGVLANISATLSSAPTLTTETFSLTTPVDANTTGSSLTVTVSPVNIPVAVLSNCDLNGDGLVNTQDVNLIVSWVLGTATPPAGMTCSLTGTGCNVDDVEIIVAASTGLSCLATAN